MKVWPQRWKAPASPGGTTARTTVPAPAAAISAPLTRARKPRREVLEARSSASRSRCSGIEPDLPSPMWSRDLAPGPAALRGRHDALELGEVVEGPLGQHGPVGARGRSRRGCPGSSSSRQAWASATSSKTRTSSPGSARRLSIAGSSVWQRWQPSLLKTARPSEPCGDREPRAPPAPRPDPVPRRRSPARPGCRAAGAACRPRAPAPAPRRRAPQQASSATPSPRPSHSSVLRLASGSEGSSAKPAASTRLRSTAHGVTRERAPKQAQGAPACPRIRAADASAARTSPSARRRRRPPNRGRRRPRPRGRARVPAGRPTRCGAIGPSPKPKVASAAWLDAGEASFARAAPPSTPASRRRSTSSIIPRPNLAARAYGERGQISASSCASFSSSCTSWPRRRPSCPSSFSSCTSPRTACPSSPPGPRLPRAGWPESPRRSRSSCTNRTTSLQTGFWATRV